FAIYPITSIEFAFTQSLLQEAGEVRIADRHDRPGPLAQPLPQFGLAAPLYPRYPVDVTQVPEAPYRRPAGVHRDYHQRGPAPAQDPDYRGVARRQPSCRLGEPQYRAGIHGAAMSISARRSRTSSGTGCCRARSRRLPFHASSRQLGSGQTYAPRPANFPVGSTVTCPSGVRTTRPSSRLARTWRQPTQVRCGTLRGFTAASPL